jgi:hypothetical protein
VRNALTFERARHSSRGPRFAAVAIALVLLLLVDASVADGEQPISAVTPDAEWAAVFTRTEGWTGADAAGSIDLGDGRTLWTFGDTWIGKIRDGKRLPGAWMVNNSIAVHATDKAAPWRPPDPRTVKFLWGPIDKEGHPTAWLVPPAVPGQAESEKNRDWFWATGGGIVTSRDKSSGRRLAIFFFRTRRDPNGKGVWNFKTVGTSLAVIDNVSDPPERWHPRVVDIPRTGRLNDGRSRQPELEILWGMSAAISPDAATASASVLVFGTRRSGALETGLVMARAPAAGIERFAEWKPIGDDASPRGLAAGAARPLVKGLVSEFTVEKIEHNGRTTWVLVQSEPLLGHRIFVRTATEPTGPWSRPRPIFRVPEVATNRNYFTYAAKGHAPLSRPGELLVTYLVNSQNFGDLVSDTTIYRPQFLRVPASVIFGQ